MSSELRVELQRLVNEWARDLLSTEQLHALAEALWEAGGEWAEYAESDPRSIDVEALSQLEIMNHQLITRDDAPALLSFLATKPGGEQQAWQAWRAYWQSIDYSARTRELAGDRFYVPRR